MSYTKITQEEAKKLMDTRDDILIVDVRNPEEYAQGHIPHAINLSLIHSDAADEEDSVDIGGRRVIKKKKKKKRRKRRISNTQHNNS